MGEAKLRGYWHPAGQFVKTKEVTAGNIAKLMINKG